VSLGRSVLRRVRKQPIAFWALLAFIFTVAWEDAVVLDGIGTLSRVIGVVALGLVAAGVLRSRASMRT
jgi:hypothetical protein